jgi:hypothetical protein
LDIEKEIVAAIRNTLGKGCQFSAARRSEFLTVIDVQNLNQDEKAVLFQSMGKIVLSAS